MIGQSSNGTDRALVYPQHSVFLETTRWTRNPTQNHWFLVQVHANPEHPIMSPPSSREDVISLAEIIAISKRFGRRIWSERGMIARRVGLAGLVGAFIAFGSPEEYSASVRLLPYKGGGGAGAAGLSGLAGLAGIRLPAGAGDVTITADLYPEVVKSLDFRIAVAETPLRFSTLNRRVSTIEYFRKIQKPAITEIVTAYSIGLPRRVLSWFSQSESNAGVRETQSADTATIRKYDQEYLTLVGKLGRRLKISTDKKTGIVLVTGKMPDPYAAADLVTVSADRLMGRIIEYESRKAADNFRFANEQHQQARIRYERIQRELAAFSDRNRALMSATSQIERERLQREYDIAFEVYQQFSRELEQTRIKMNQDTPVFTVLDQVIVPNTRASPHRLVIVASSLLLGALLGVCTIGFRALLHSDVVEIRLRKGSLST